ncbi:DUF3330 domain-containing protein [Pseudomonas aeruginosa]|uniref:DUF3330 domain-containing protein n=1 Tax=Pseudomonas aeruginosa TaxID=287 RepID=UPI003CCADB89
MAWCGPSRPNHHAFCCIAGRSNWLRRRRQPAHTSFYTASAGSSPSLPDGSNPSAAIVQSASDVQCSRLLKTTDSTTTSCCVCCKEIPLDAAFTPEGAEYVEHFCGLECYQRFEARAKTGNETDADPNACDSLPSD